MIRVVFSVVILFFFSLSLSACSSRYDTARQAASEKVGHWEKFDTLMVLDGQRVNPNAFHILGKHPSQDHELWAIDAYTNLSAAARNSDPRAISYVCDQWIGYSAVAEIAYSVCPSISHTTVQALVCEGNTDRINNAKPAINQSDVVLLVEKYKGVYTREAWVFDSVLLRRAFELEIAPYRSGSWPSARGC